MVGPFSMAFDRHTLLIRSNITKIPCVRVKEAAVIAAFVKMLPTARYATHCGPLLHPIRIEAHCIANIVTRNYFDDHCRIPLLVTLPLCAHAIAYAPARLHFMSLARKLLAEH
jgi:hypothetical protein